MFRRCPDKEYLQPKAACQAHQADARRSSTILKHSGAQLMRPTVCAIFNGPILEGNQV